MKMKTSDEKGTGACYASHPWEYDSPTYFGDLGNDQHLLERDVNFRDKIKTKSMLCQGSGHKFLL